jgi:hypothetical protein
MTGILMRFEGTFLNEQGKKVNWWFEAPDFQSLKEHLAEKKWSIINLFVRNQITDSGTLRGLRMLRICRRISVSLLFMWIFLIYLVSLFESKVLPLVLLFLLFWLLFSYLFFARLTCPCCDKIFFGWHWTQRFNKKGKLDTFDTCLNCDVGLYGEFKEYLIQNSIELNQSIK